MKQAGRAVGQNFDECAKVHDTKDRTHVNPARLGISKIICVDRQLLIPVAWKRTPFPGLGNPESRSGSYSCVDPGCALAGTRVIVVSIQFLNGTARLKLLKEGIRCEEVGIDWLSVRI